MTQAEWFTVNGPKSEWFPALLEMGRSNYHFVFNICIYYIFLQGEIPSESGRRPTQNMSLRFYGGQGGVDSATSYGQNYSTARANFPHPRGKRPTRMECPSQPHSPQGAAARHGLGPSDWMGSAPVFGVALALDMHRGETKSIYTAA